MSESFSRVLYPFEIARGPSLEPEVQRALLARWSSNPGQASSGTGRAATRPATGADEHVSELMRPSDQT
jgi:hypothetical protein